MMRDRDPDRKTVFQQMREREQMKKDAREAEERKGRSPVLDKMAEHMEAPMAIRDVHGATSSCRPAAHPAHEGTFCYGADSIVVVWDWRGDSRRLLQGHSMPVQALGFTAGGGVLASTDGRDIILWQTSGGWSIKARASKVLSREGGRKVLSLVCAGTELKPLVVTAEGPAEVTATRGPSKGSVLRVWDASTDGILLCGQFVFDHAASPPGAAAHLCTGVMGLVIAATHDALWGFQIEAGLPQEGAMLPGEGDAGRLEPLRGMGAEGGGRGGLKVTARWVAELGGELVGCCWGGGGGGGGVFALNREGVLYEVEEMRGGIVKRQALDDGGGGHTCVAAPPGGGRVVCGTARGVVSVRKRSETSGLLAVSSRVALASDLHRRVGPRQGQRGRG